MRKFGWGEHYVALIFAYFFCGILGVCLLFSSSTGGGVVAAIGGIALIVATYIAARELFDFLP